MNYSKRSMRKRRVQFFSQYIVTIFSNILFQVFRRTPFVKIPYVSTAVEVVIFNVVLFLEDDCRAAIETFGISTRRVRGLKIRNMVLLRNSARKSFNVIISPLFCGFGIRQLLRIIISPLMLWFWSNYIKVFQNIVTAIVTIKSLRHQTIQRRSWSLFTYIYRYYGLCQS